MIVVRVELHSAITGGVTEIGRTVVYNDGTGSRDRGSYEVRVMRKRAPRDLLAHHVREGARRHFYRTGRVEDYPRRSYDVWRLVMRALAAAFPEERPSANRGRRRRA